ncbi:MAG: hypothetical protein HQL29_00330 [Candidatus Omnitrophica bacterium]|nr:hypothetical protein [Candidatus Omnitrophota bacterium]
MSKRSSIVLFFAIILVVSIVRVHQKIEVLKLGYRIQEEQMFISNILEKNSKLMYELSILESPKMLINNLDCKDIIFKGERSKISDNCIIALDEQRLVDAGRQRSVFGHFFNTIAEAGNSNR